MKFVYPIVCPGILFGVAVTAFIFTPPDPNTALLKWMFAALAFVSTVFFELTCLRLKRVQMDDKAMYISNYLTEIVVPLHDVAEVTENRWSGIHPVTIKFRKETEFGSQIVFMPKKQVCWWLPHPVVSEIRDAMARAGGNAPAD